MIASALSATIFVFFGSAAYAFASLSITARICSDSSNSADEKSAEMRLLLSNISKVGMVVAFAHLGKSFTRSTWIDKTGGQDLDFILFSIGSLFAASLATIRLNQPQQSEETATGTVLPRAQTDELKGIMQLLLWIGHFYENTKQTDPVRLLFACTFLWLTGFCHASYYLNTSDFGIDRLVFILLRMNFLPFLLALTSGKPKEFSSFPACPIHSIAYVMVYIIMKVSGKTRGSDRRHKRRQILLIAFVALCLSGITFSSFLPILLFPTLFGISFACNRSEIKRQFINLETGSNLRVVSKKITILITMVGSTIGLTLLNDHVKGRKLEVRPFLVTFITPFAYALCRNVAPSLRQHTLALFSAIGSVSLEFYVLHQHLCGTPNTVAVSPVFPKVRILLTGALNYYAARASKSATNSITGSWRRWLQNRFFRGQMLTGLALVFILCLGLKVTALLTSVSISVISGYFGFILYQGSINSTSLSVSAGNRRVQAICLVATLLFGFAFQLFQNSFQIESNRSNKTCEKDVLEGSWVSVDTCTDSTLGNKAISSFGTCESLQWAWKTSSAHSQCQFTHRKPKILQQSLGEHRITFIGDSEIRHLFYAVCRSLGDSSAGAYNTTIEKHSDVAREYDNLSMGFRWAPFVQNLSTALEAEILTSSPDAIVIGGGAWDLLHNFNEKQEQQIVLHSVSHLAKYLKNLDKPTVWVTPTTINTWALNSEEKRNKIREEQMQAFRELYKQAGINDAVTFLFDGTSYTKDRVNECYDGVHYPFSVYDGGAQILANAFDWLLISNSTSSPSQIQGLLPSFLFLFSFDVFEYLVLLFIFSLAIYAFDNFCGSFYVASLVWSELSPHCPQADDGRDASKESDEEIKSGESDEET